MLNIFLPKTQLNVSELADFLFSNSDKTLSRINCKTKEHIENHNRFIDHINYLKDTISPYSIDKNKIHELDFKMIQLKINEIYSHLDELIDIVHEDQNHLVLLEKINVFESKFDEINNKIKEPLTRIEIYFKDMIPVLMDKLNGMKENLLSLKNVLDNKVIHEYYNLHNNLLTLKEIYEITNSKSKSNKKLNTDSIKHKARLNELKSKKDSLTYTESFKMSEKTYKDYRDLIQKISVERELISKSFEDVIPLFKAYNSKFFERVVDNYILSASDALISDKDLVIDNHLKKIQKMIKEEKIKISKNEKGILKALDILKKPELKLMQKKISGFEEDLKRKKILLSKNKIMLDVTELDYQIDHLLGKISNIESELNEGVDNFNVNFDELLEKSLKEISKFTNRRVVIKND